MPVESFERHKDEGRRHNQFVEIDSVELADADLATLDALIRNIRPHILIVLLVFEATRIDGSRAPLSFVVILDSATNLIAPTLFHVLLALAPLEAFDLAEHHRVVHRLDIESGITDGTIHCARASEEQGLLVLSVDCMHRCFK